MPITRHAQTFFSSALFSRHALAARAALAAMAVSATQLAACGGSAPDAPPPSVAGGIQATVQARPSSLSHTAPAPEPLVVRACCDSADVDAKALHAAAAK